MDFGRAALSAGGPMLAELRQRANGAPELWMAGGAAAPANDPQADERAPPPTKHQCLQHGWYCRHPILNCLSVSFQRRRKLHGLDIHRAETLTFNSFQTAVMQYSLSYTFRVWREGCNRSCQWSLSASGMVRELVPRPPSPTRTPRLADDLWDTRNSNDKLLC